jgi:hypothetical protein
MSWQDMMKYREALAELWADITELEGIKSRESAVNAAQYLALTKGDAYFVTGNIVDLIEATAADLPDDASLEPQCLLSDKGFAWFEHPMPSVQVTVGRSKAPASMSGISWYTLGTPSKLVIEVYGKTPHVPCYPMLSSVIELGKPLPPVTPEMVERGDPNAAEYKAGTSGDMEAAAFINRVLLTFYLFVHQHIVVTNPVKLNRQQRRQAERKNEPLDAPLIVTLRRAEKSKKKGDKTGMTLQLRVPTRPHWQRYHKGPKNDPTQQRVEWQLKDLYWRGPEDAPVKPLVQRVFKASR